MANKIVSVCSYQPPGSFDAFWKQSITEEQKVKGEQRKRGKGTKRFTDNSSQFAPPSIARKPKKKKEGPYSTTGKGCGKSSEGRKFSGAEGKQLKTAKNDSVKAKDRKKRERDGKGRESTGASNVTGSESKMETN